MKRYDKLIFVDKENTSISPMAEAIMQHRFLLEDILIESRGLVVLFPEPVNPKAEEVLSEEELTMVDHTSILFSEDDFDERTLILEMEQSQKEKINAEFPEPINVFTLREYIGADADVSNPYGGSLDEYRACRKQLEQMTGRLADILKQEEN